MITKLGLENFKGFNNLQDLNLAPITILCGTNSCGKSSILQSILALKQTFESKDPNQALLLNGRFVHLGTFENLIYQRDTNNKLGFEFQLSAPNDDSLKSANKMPLNFIIRDFIAKDWDEKREYYVKVKAKLKVGKQPKRGSHIRPIVIHSLEFFVLSTLNKEEEVTHGAVLLTHIKENEYQIDVKNIKMPFGEKMPLPSEMLVKIQFANLMPISIEPIEEREKQELYLWNFLFFRFRDFIQTVLSSCSYIGPLREEPSRRYIYEDEIVEIGIKGENAAYIYLSEEESKIENHYFYDQKNEKFQLKKGAITLKDAMSKWFSLMGINDLRAEASNEVIRMNLNSNSFSDTRVSIADVGFGVSQVFPIILEGLRIEKGDTLLLEQPEIHLHPKLQMQMADYFLSLALSGKRLIIETHSDHIINRIVRRIVEDKEDQFTNLIQIYFVSTDKDGSRAEPITIDPDNGILNWPTDFFDQIASEQELILRAGLNKRKAKLQ